MAKECLDRVISAERRCCGSCRPLRLAPVRDPPDAAHGKSQVTRRAVGASCSSSSLVSCVQRAESRGQGCFVGYSLPTSDAAAGSLFGEALLGKTLCIQVVNLGENGKTKPEVMDSYGETFTAISPEQFAWSGAHEWAAELVAGDVE